MAIAPNTQEFFNLKQSVESLIDAGTITNQRQLKAFLEENDVNFKKFMEVDKEYEKRKSKGVLEKDTTFSPGKVVGSAVGKVAEDIGSVTGDALEFIAGKETRETVEGGIGAVADYLDEVLPTTLTYAAKETFDPRVNLGEDIAAEVAAFAAPAGALTKATKFIKPASKTGKIAKAGAIGVTADVMTRNEDETFVTELAKLVPETEQYVERIAIDPDDTVAEKRLKQLLDSAVVGGIIAIPAAVALRLAKSGGRRLIGRLSAQQSNITQPITRTRTSTATRAAVTETSPGVFNQSGTIKQVVGKINTKLGRMFTSTASLPEPIFKSTILKNQFEQASDALIRKEARELEKLLKRTGVDPRLVNALLQEQPLTTAQMRQIPQEVVDVVYRMRTKIDNNSMLAKDLLEIPDDSKLGLALNPETGGAYITRTFEFTTNPQWSKDIAKAIKNELPDTPHNADVINAVRRMQIHVARSNPDLSPEQINAILMDIIDRGKKDTSFNIISELLERGTGGAAVKILKGRKDLDQPVLDFLGEVKDPVRNFVETMTNQNKLIAKARYIKDIKKYAEENVGQEIELGGLFPFLPKETTTFLRKGQFGPDIDVRANLGELAQKELGGFGAGGEVLGLNKYVTTKEFSDMLDKGIDTFGVDNPVGKGWLNLFAKPAAVGQAMETVFDHTAHLLNTYGMFQQLAMNGVLYRPRVAKEAYKSAYAMYQKAAKGDEDTLKFLQALKNRGIIDSSVVSEAIKKNIDRFGREGADAIEGTITKTIKAPFRGMSAVYGGVDDFGKIVAFQAEFNAYKKAYPNLTDAEIFDKVTEIVRNTMPSYTTAAPAVRALTRLPFGTYATFPAEMIRTTKNIVSQGVRDIAEGKRTNNPALIRIGMRRLAGLGATTAGIEYAINNQNSQMGVGENEKRAVNLAVPEYQVNTTKMYTQPFYKDPKTGEVMTRFVDTGFIDSMQVIKGPIRRVIGRVLAGDDVTQREIDDAFPDAARELYSPYISEKFLTTAVLNAFRGYDEEGRELSAEERFKEIGNVFLPGSVKAGQKYLNAQQSELLRGEGRGQTAAGFPMRKEDQAMFLATGIRNNTMSFDKSVSYSLYQDAQEINKSKKDFAKYLKTIPDRQLTQEDISNIFNTYYELQLQKREAMARMSDKANVFRNVEFYEEGKDGKIVKRKYGIDGIMKASTQKGKYKVNPNLIYSVIEGPEGQGIFMPDSLNEGEIMKLLQERKFPVSVINGLKRIEAEFSKLPLRK